MGDIGRLLDRRTLPRTAFKKTPATLATNSAIGLDLSLRREGRYVLGDKAG